MNALASLLVVLLLLSNLWILGGARVGASITRVAFQGAVTGLLALAVHPHGGWRTIGLAVGVVTLKGAVFPFLLRRGIGRGQPATEAGGMLGPLPAMLVGIVSAAVALAAAARLPVDNLGPGSALLAGTALATVLSGFVVMITRFKAVSLVVGYLMVENGIFTLGMLLVESTPLLVEAGVLLDLFVAMFVTSELLGHIHAVYESMDTRLMTRVRE